MNDFLRTVFNAVRFLFGLKPSNARPLHPITHFWLIALMISFGFAALLAVRAQLKGMGISTGHAWGDTLLLYWWAFKGVSVLALLSLAAATLVAYLLKRQVIGMSLATYWMTICATFLLCCLALWTIAFDRPGPEISVLTLRIGASIAIALFIWSMITASMALSRCMQASGQAMNGWRSQGLSVVAATLIIGTTLANEVQIEYWFAEAEEDLSYEEGDLPEPKLAYNPEKVMYAQQKLLREALADIKPGEPDVTDLFVLSFGGDGSEGVFLNEVNYTKALFEQRFGADGRVLQLANHSHTTDSLPLATVTNLRAALRHLKTKMQEEDFLFVMFTTHGSEDHELLVQQGPLPLDQLKPEPLAALLNSTQVGTQIVLVSACYSGGFIPALTAPNRVVMTAASATQPSFGCGAASDITYFGKAYLVEALNKTNDFIKAFEIAVKSVTEREKRMGYAPSNPQIKVGDNALLKINAWKKNHRSGDPVPFFPDERNRDVKPSAVSAKNES